MLTIRIATIYLILSPVFSFAGDEASQLAKIERDVEALKQSQAEIQKNIKVIRDLLQGKQPPLENVSIDVSGSPSLGSDDAKLVLVEFSDFQCTFCASYHRETFGHIVTDYVKTGKVRYISRNFPLEQPHPLAEKAAEAAMCAGAQGKYWEAHDRFFGADQSLAVAAMPGHAAALGLDSSVFLECIKTEEFASVVARDVADGKVLGVRGTPTFFIGYAEPGKPMVIHARISLVGNVAFREFERAFAEVLAEFASNPKVVAQ